MKVNGGKKEKPGKPTLREEQEANRRQAGVLFRKGLRTCDVATECGVTWQCAHGWRQRYDGGGASALRSKGKTGPLARLKPLQRAQLTNLLKLGAVAQGYANELWTLPRVAEVIRLKFGVKLGTTGVWKVLRQLGFTPQKPERRAREQNRALVEAWKTQRWPLLREEAREQGRTIVFIDESGLSQKPARKRTWAKRGQTPILEFNFNWKKLSAIAGVTFCSFFFALHEGTIKSAEVIEFLRQLQNRIEGPMLIVWDGLRAHWSKAVQAYVATTGERLRVEKLPAYAPELNPVEYLWGHLKAHELANFAARSVGLLSSHARKTLRKTQRRPDVIQAFWIQAELAISSY